MKNRIKTNIETEDLLDEEDFRRSLRDGLAVDSSPQFFFQEWFEVVRSLFSGLGKGQKFVDFAGNPLQEPDEQSHYHNSTSMNVFALGVAALFGGTLALRALARGFGRAPLGEDPAPKSDGHDSDPRHHKTGDTTTSEGGEKAGGVEMVSLPPSEQESAPELPKPHSSSRLRSLLSQHSFFGSQSSGTKKHMSRSESDTALALRA